MSEDYNARLAKIEPQIWREEIEKALAAQDDSWRALVPKIDTWQEITIAPETPPFEGTSWNLSDYDYFFGITVNRETPTVPARTMADALGKGTEWDDYAKKHDASLKLAQQGVEGQWEVYLTDLNRFVGEMVGISESLTPSNKVSESAKKKGAYSTWHQINPVSMSDVLLYLYEDSTIKEEKDLQADAIKKAQEAIEKDPDNEHLKRALKFALAAQSQEEFGHGEGITDEMIRSMENLGDEDFLARGLRESAQCVLRLSIGDYIQAHQITSDDAQDSPISMLPRYDPHIFLSYGNATTLINKLAYCKGGQNFLDVQTHQISQLVPMVRLFKCYYGVEGEVAKEIEINFGKGFLNSTSPGETVLQSRSGVGIKSFDWKLNATNPFTVKNDIEVTLVLFFESFAELLKPLEGTDLISGTPEWFQYQELLLRPEVDRPADPFAERPAPGCPEDNNTVYDPRFYEIKALVGWAPPPTLEGASETLLESIKSQKLPLFLTLIDHEFSFTQEGTFELSITYRARMEGIETDPRMDILSTKKSKEQINTTLKNIENLRKTCGSEKLIEREKKAIAKLIKKDHDLLSESLINDLQTKIYFTRMDKADFDSGMLHNSLGMAHAPNITGLKVFKEDILKAIRHRQESWQEEVQKEVLGRLAKDFDTTTPSYEKEKKGQTSKWNTEKGYILLDPPGRPPGATERNRKARPETYAHEITSTEIVIPWFYFGDLVDAVVKRCYSVDIAKSASNSGAFSSVELENLIFLFSSFPVIEVDQNGVVKYINANLADVPISLELFNQWYLAKVRRANRQNYPILEFLRDFISDVVVGTLNKDCYDSPEFRNAWFGATDISKDLRLSSQKALGTEMTQYYGSSEEGRVRAAGDATLYEIPHLIMKTAVLSIPSISNSGDPEKQDRTMLGPNPLHDLRLWTDDSHDGLYAAALIDIDLAHPSELNLAKRSTSFTQSLKNSYHLNVFYLLNSDSYANFRPINSWEDTTREERDKKNGVFHLYLGADRGLVKSVSFSKVSAQYLREARIQQESLNPLAQLAATYNVNLKLIGNTIFWPGQYIFVNPIGFGNGLGQPDSCGTISNQLGLGGYHLITQVNNFIENGKFETEVKALFEFSGDGRPSIPGATPTDSQCDKVTPSAGTSTKDTTNPTSPPKPSKSSPGSNSHGKYSR
jgi:hypothetical protein